MDSSVVLWALALGLLLCFMLVGTFAGGMALGMRIGSGGTRGLLGVVKGDSSQAADPEYGFSGSEERIKDMLKRTFGADWTEEGETRIEVGQPELRRAAQEYDEAMAMADRQVKRFLDSTVAGRGPRRARSGEAEDDERNCCCRGAALRGCRHSRDAGQVSGCAENFIAVHGSETSRPCGDRICR